MASLVLYSPSTSLLVPLFYSSSSDTSCIHSHTFLYLLLSLATNSSSLLTLLFSIFLHVQLLVYHDVTGLSLLLASHLLVYISFLPLTLTLLLSVIDSLLIF